MHLLPQDVDAAGREAWLAYNLPELLLLGLAAVFTLGTSYRNRNPGLRLPVCAKPCTLTRSGTSMGHAIAAALKIT